MDPVKEELIKHREIRFCPERETVVISEKNATDAIQLLQGVKGIRELKQVNVSCVLVSYDISLITMRIIEEALQEVGFVLDGSWVCRMRRAIYYTEETQLVNMGYSHQHSKSTTEIFIKQYEQREHGCRDERPPYYHHYN